MNSPRKQILLTNDDGINSPGIWAAAQALAPLGYVTIVAPNVQYSGAGRSHPLYTDGTIQEQKLTIGGQEWPAYAINGSPAQAVMFAVLDVLPERPDLVVSGINYGENVGSDITMSGTVGAALEGAAWGVPAIAISLQITNDDYTGNSHSVDFSMAAYFCAYFAQKVLEKGLPEDTQVLKVDVPAHADQNTPWRMVRSSPVRYFMPHSVGPRKLNERASLRYSPIPQETLSQHPQTDAYTVSIAKEVAVTPLSVDMTSRAPLDNLDSFFR
jgi:5'-nucleotidase